MKSQIDISTACRKATERTAAYVVLLKGKCPGVMPEARIVIRYPRDGAGRLTAYVWRDGSGWTQGSATGYGYDKATAAMAMACPGWVYDTGESWDNQIQASGTYLLMGAC